MEYDGRQPTFVHAWKTPSGLYTWSGLDSTGLIGKTTHALKKENIRLCVTCCYCFPPIADSPILLSALRCHSHTLWGGSTGVAPVGDGRSAGTDILVFYYLYANLCPVNSHLRSSSLRLNSTFCLPSYSILTHTCKQHTHARTCFTHLTVPSLHPSPPYSIIIEHNHLVPYYRYASHMFTGTSRVRKPSSQKMVAGKMP